MEAADELIQYVDDETIAAAQQVFSRMDSKVKVNDSIE